jgi:hypothetical protein
MSIKFCAGKQNKCDEGEIINLVAGCWLGGVRRRNSRRARWQPDDDNSIREHCSRQAGAEKQCYFSSVIAALSENVARTIAD